MKTILEDFIIKSPEGLFCKYGDFYLDPQLPVKNAVVSHAHGDHARPGNLVIYCTSFTQKIMALRFKKNAGGQFILQDYKSEFTINGVKISFYPAGHILGSAMILMTYNNVKYLYTGDYKLQEDITCEPLELPEAEVLITETTFAKPEVQHPSVEEEIKKLNGIKSNILLGVYGLGKAQRITELMNRFCPEKNILVHYSIFPIHQLYHKENIDLGSYKLYDRKTLKQHKENQVYLVPPLTFNSYRNAKGVAKVFASGWSYLQKGNDLDLYISDHVDWNDILKTISIVKPLEVWTLHGDGTVLKNYFENKLIVKIL